jgi:YesN/AraC family two-component response regulator
MPHLVKKGYINIILGMLLDHYPTISVKTADGMEIMVDILHYIDEHYKEPITLESIADAFGYNKCYFSRMFNRYIGESLLNYVNIVRLREFMERMKEKNPPAISKLAAECGFESMPTFYRAFTKLYGESPKCYLSKN